MIDRNVYTVGFGIELEIETLEFAYPYSLVKFTYKVEGKPKQTKYAYLGYTTKGQIYIKSKNPIPKLIQIAIGRQYPMIPIFITKWNALKCIR